MKNPWEWDESDLLEIITTGTKESIELDFKASAALQNVKGKTDVRYEISKDISALANSAGGSLIYGVCEDKQHMATKLDEGSDPNEVTKEWLQQVITTTVHRKIDGLRVNQVDLKTQSPGKVAYVVYVPQSMRAPHQALDKKFYKRYEFESVAMEEYEVRDLYRRGEVPDLRLDFALSDNKLIFKSDAKWSEPVSLIASIANDAAEPANYARITLFLDRKLRVVSAKGMKIEQIPMHLALIRLTSLTMDWGIPDKLPIFGVTYAPLSFAPVGIPFPLNDEPLRIAFPPYAKTEGTFLLGYTILSPRQPLKPAFFLLTVKDGSVQLFPPEGFLTFEEITTTYREELSRTELDALMS